jgi:segregation and condensation protein A
MVYDVHLEIFEGPLDLLLYLIRKNDLEISEIPIAQITTEYLGYLDIMKELNLEIAGDFLVMASTLMQIKARMLLPAPEADEDEGPDPLEELKAKLLEYQKFKEVSQFLSHKENEFSNVHYRPAPVFEKDDYVLEVSLFDLIEGFRNVLKELPKDVKEIVYQEIPIEQKIREILDLLEGKQFISFLDIFRLQTTRQALVVSFLAVLELIRLKQIIACQPGQFGDIRIYRALEGKPVIPEDGVRETLSGEGELGTADSAEQAPAAASADVQSTAAPAVENGTPQEQSPAVNNEKSPEENNSHGIS